MDPLEFKLDAIVTVVDALNFTGYEDTSLTARLQAQYTDLIIVNKCELVSERELDVVMDHINELNTDTPKVFSHNRTIHPDLVLGLGTKLFSTAQSALLHSPAEGDQEHHSREVDIMQLRVPRAELRHINQAQLRGFLEALPKEDFYRIKGMVRLEDDELHLLNYAFGRYDLVSLPQYCNDDQTLELTFMGQGLGAYQARLQNGLLGVLESHIVIYPRHDQL